MSGADRLHALMAALATYMEELPDDELLADVVAAGGDPQMEAERVRALLREAIARSKKGEP